MENLVSPVIKAGNGFTSHGQWEDVHTYRPTITAITELSAICLSATFGFLKGASFAALLLFVIAQPSNAQNLPDAGSTLETLKPVPPPPPVPLPPIQVPETPKLPLTAPDLRVGVKAFVFSGNNIFSTTELSALVAPYVGKELDFAGLNEVAAIITAHYSSHGYIVSQAYLPQQEIRDGVIEIAVLEARLGQIKINQAPQSRLQPSAVKQVLEPLSGGTPIEVRALERPLLLLNDRAGIQAQAALEPGSRVGEADLTVDVVDVGTRVRGTLEADNHGSRYTGEYRAGGFVARHQSLRVR